MVPQFLTLLLLTATTLGQQYNDPYNNSNNNSNYNQYSTNRNYDNRPPYGSNQYSSSQNYNVQQYGSNPYDSNRQQPYDPNNPNRNDPNRPYDPNNPNRNDPNRPYDPNNPNRYDPNRPYDPNNPNRYDPNRPFDPNNPNRGQYDSNRPYDPNNPNRYDSNRQNDNNRYQYDSNRPFDSNYNNSNRDGRPYDSNRQNDYNRQQYDVSSRYNDNNRQGSDQSFGYNQQQLGGNNNEDCCENYCYTEDPEAYLKFGSKTAYETLDKKSGQQHIVPECVPIQIWSLNRHGSRLPSRRRIEPLRKLDELKRQVVLNHEERQSYPDKGRMCVKDYDLLKRWTWNQSISENFADSLTAEGISELRLLARRYKNKFPQLLNEPYNDRTYYFQYADSDKTHASYQAYIEGLFGPEYVRVHGNFYPDDKIIQANQNCRIWQEQVDRNPRTYEEYNKFTQMPDYQRMVRNVFKRLGFRLTLNPNTIYDIYDMCRYEKAWYVNRPSAWCAAFTKEQLMMMEYASDLKSFYKRGYGNEMNRKIGCSTVKDMYQKFEKAVNGEREGPKASFFFTTAQTLGTTLAAMGLVKDYQPLRADNYHHQNRRQWRDSNNLPFSANLVAVLYECRSSEKHKVMFFLNEEPVEFPECQVGLCNWSTFQEKFRNVVETCDLNSFCEGRSGATKHTWQLTLLLAPLVYFLISRI